jgi:CBS domain-containing protein
MKTLTRLKIVPEMALDARTAADLMTPNPKSVRENATAAEAAAFLSVRGISAGPVIDDAGRPVGVVSRTDLLHHRGQKALRLMGSPEFYERLGRPVFSDGGPDAGDRVTVRAIMTPVVFCVRPETPAAKVVEKMLALKVRRLFVVDEDGVLTGVISAFDVLGKLRRC